MAISASDRTDHTRRPRRADAQQTHDRILAVANAVFTEHGADASLNEVAQRAGVGPGTLYRHFPTRQALLEALLSERFAELRDTARDLLDAPDTAEALTAWLRAFINHLTTYRGLSASVMDTLCDPESSLFASCQDMRESGGKLLTRAKQTGLVDVRVDEADLLALANAIAWVTERSPAHAGRGDNLLTLLGHGLWSR